MPHLTSNDIIVVDAELDSIRTNLSALVDLVDTGDSAAARLATIHLRTALGAVIEAEHAMTAVLNEFIAANTTSH